MRAIVNQDAGVTAEYDYMPYGMQHKNSSLATSDANEFRYNGKEFLFFSTLIGDTPINKLND